MTGRAKSGTTRIETEIEKNREEGNWSKVIELAEQLKEKSLEFECLAEFLIGEGRLENYLDEWPPIDANVNRAKLNCMEAKRNLLIVTHEAGIKAGVAMDAHLLLGKLYYACGHYSDSVKSYSQADLSNLSEKKLPLRSLRIVAESYAIKGLCLQKDTTGISSKYKKVEREEEITRCFELASDLALLYMQMVEKEQNVLISATGTHSPQPPSSHKTLGVILEQALQQAPVSHMQKSKSVMALERYRASLSAIESPGVNTIRLKFLCRTAELLLHGLLGDDYKPPVNSFAKNSVWKPKVYVSLNQFIPKHECEEIILVLLIAETMAVRNAVLSQSPEFKEARLSAYQDATTVYDLLTIASVRWGQAALLQESLERAMKFSFEELHLWRQHALSLITIGRYTHALSVLKQVIRLNPENCINYLLVARLCYEHLNLTHEGTNFSNEAKTCELTHPSGLLGRCHLYIGIGYHLQAEMCLLKREKQDLYFKALKNFETAVQLDPNDHLSEYYLGLQLAVSGYVHEALIHVNKSLALRSENSSALHLLTLLLSANQQHREALDLVETALEDYPDCLNLMYVKAHLELHEYGGEKALVTVKQMLELWKSLYEGQTSSDVPECDRKSDTRSVFQLYTSEMSDKDSSSLQLQSTAASRIEQALSEVASSMSSFSPKPGPQRAWLLLVEVWLLLAELYLSMDQPDYVQQCIQEATQIFPLSHHIMHMRGLLHMYRKEWLEAKLCFQNAVAINPQHVKSLQQLGLVYHYLGLQGLAETTLRESARIDPQNHVTWYNLGKVLEALSEYEKASDSMANALSVETTCPVLPFNSVPLCFN